MLDKNAKFKDKKVLNFIIEQGELRLKGTCEHANSQDLRASSLLNACIALSTASTAAMAAGFFSPTKFEHQSLIRAITSVSALGFLCSTIIVLLSIQSSRFHPLGWKPTSFTHDIIIRKNIGLIKIDYINELEIRINENENTLYRRGNLINISSYLLTFTPIISIITGILFEYVIYRLV